MELIIVLLSVAGMFLWNRAESREDIRTLVSEISGVKLMLDSFRQEMHKEMRDFHGRLCKLEEKNKGK